jgi:hypothetical protein
MNKRIGATVGAFLVYLILWQPLWAEEQTVFFLKEYSDKLVTADYQGAIKLALQQYKKSEAWDVVQPLANAYLLNYQPSLANTIVEKYLNESRAPAPIDAYYASASISCELGNYNRAYERLEIAEKMYPDQLLKIKTHRLSCKMKETDSERQQDIKKQELFLAEVKEHLKNTTNLKTNSPRIKAVLAREILHDMSLAKEYTKDELALQSMIAKKTIGDRGVIPASTRGFVALFLALGGETKQAKQLLACGHECKANELILGANDLLYLSRCFAVFDDMSSSDKALRFLWEQMKTDEQKGQFFKYVLEKVDKDSPWAKQREIQWLRNEYLAYLRERK